MSSSVLAARLSPRNTEFVRSWPNSVGPQARIALVLLIQVIGNRSYNGLLLIGGRKGPIGRCVWHCRVMGARWEVWEGLAGNELAIETSNDSSQPYVGVGTRYGDRIGGTRAKHWISYGTCRRTIDCQCCSQNRGQQPRFTGGTNDRDRLITGVRRYAPASCVM